MSTMSAKGKIAMFKKISLGLAVAALMAGTRGARAAEGFSHPVTLVVSTHGLNLSVPADQARMQHRVELATRRLCQDIAAGALNACYDDTYADAWSRAQAQIDAAVSHSLFASANP
jgi:UrcA family protein